MDPKHGKFAKNYKVPNLAEIKGQDNEKPKKMSGIFEIPFRFDHKCIFRCALLACSSARVFQDYDVIDIILKNKLLNNRCDLSFCLCGRSIAGR